MSEGSRVEEPGKAGTWPPEEKMRREYESLRSGSAVVEWGEFSVLDVHGPDAAGFLQGMLSNDVAALAVGEGCRAVLLTPIGKMVADFVTLRRQADRFHLLCSREAMPKASAALSRFIITDRVEVTELSDMSGLAVLGPGSRAVLGGHADLPSESLGSLETSLAGAPVLIVRDTRFGVEGYSLWADRTLLDPVKRLALEGGALAAGREAFEALRIEAGVPSHGVDFDETVLPLECGLDAAVSFSKGCYVGQEVISRVTYLGGVPKKLMGLTGRKGSPLTAGETLSVDGESAGRITSAAYSFVLECPVALAYVSKKFLERSVAAAGPEGTPAAIQALPIVSSQIYGKEA